MVTAFPRFGAFKRLQTGYKPQTAHKQAQKNPPRRVFLRGMQRITSVLKHLQQEPKRQRQGQRQGLMHLLQERWLQ